MGRASRKSTSSAEPREHWTDTHPDRNMWSPARLAIARTQTQEEYEALYGRGPAVESISRQKLFPLGIDIPYPFSSADRFQILAEMHVPAGTSLEDFERDPFLEALWQAELARVQREADQYEQKAVEGALEPRHWIRDFEEEGKLDLLRDTWKRSLLPEHAKKVPGSELFEGTWNGEILPYRPTSALAAARECQDVAWNENDFVRQSLLLRRRHPEEYQQFIRDTLLPDFHYLSRPLPTFRGSQFEVSSDQVACELWRAATSLAGMRTNQDGDFGEEYLGQVLWRGSKNDKNYSDLYADSPVVAEDSVWQDMLSGPGYPTLYQEAVARINVAALRADAIEEVARVQRHLFASQVMRIAYGLERDVKEPGVEQEMETIWSSDRDVSPLENLRPLFRGEGQDKLLDELIRRFRDVRDPNVYSMLHKDLRATIETPDVAKQIYDALCRIERQVR